MRLNPVSPGRKGTTSWRSANAYTFGPVSFVDDVSHPAGHVTVVCAPIRGLYGNTFAVAKLTRFARRTVAPLRASISRS